MNGKTAITFQFTPLREGRRIGQNAGERRGTYFNSRPSARGDLMYVSSRSAKYFNSRPSARGDWHTHLHSCIGYISIHAPPRGATKFDLSLLLQPKINFNSRPSARGDQSTMHRIMSMDIISIHAPPRGATTTARRKELWIWISIHAPPRGATNQGV